MPTEAEKHRGNMVIDIPESQSTDAARSLPGDGHMDDVSMDDVIAGLLGVSLVSTRPHPKQQPKR